MIAYKSAVGAISLTVIMASFLGASSGRYDLDTGIEPSSSLADFSFLLDPPAGRHGFLTVDRNGRFAWPNGRRVRFWGVNISRRSVFVDDQTMERVADILSRSGANMVRFEALDAPGGILRSDGGGLDPDRLDRLDRWLAVIAKRGIYAYLNLLDLREFNAADGVAGAGSIGRAGRPYAMFDPSLIRAQKEYAQRLLTHRNPYTGKRYVDDPALAVVELCNESGFFLRRGETERLRKASYLPSPFPLPSPTQGAKPGPDVRGRGDADASLVTYGRELARQWNRWLVRHYKDRKGLARAWGAGSLAPNEDPRRNSVRIPTLPAEGSVHLARASEYVRFLTDVQRTYFSTMRAYLRSIGLRVPVTAVTSNEYIADAASWTSLDFTAGNRFHDHPTFAGKEWVGSLFFNDSNPLRSASVYGSAPWMAALRWGRKPVVIREWAQPWPNRFRAVSGPETMAYAALQDLDGLLLFGYRTIAPRSGRPALSDFAHEADPTVWRLFGPCGLAFMRGDISPGGGPISVSYTRAEASRFDAAIDARMMSAWRSRVSSGIGRTRTSSRRANLPTPLVSSTSQIVRCTAEGVLTVATPRTMVIAGEIGKKSWYVRVPGQPTWRLTTASPIGALMIVSLDGRPLGQSRRRLATMVTEAVNTGQRIEAQPGKAPGRFKIAAVGGAPVLTGGSAAASGLLIEHGGRPWLSLDLKGGTWEALTEPDATTIVCDTGGIRGALAGGRFTTQANRPVRIAAP